MSARVVPYSEAMTHLGLGFETSLGRVKASPFLYEPEAKTSIFHGNSAGEDGPPQTAVQYKLRFIESRSDLADSLSIGGKFSVRRANLSGSVGGSYLDTELRTAENVYLLITVEVSHSVTMVAADPEINPGLVPGLPGSIDQEAFLELYGDSFVSAIEVGGRLDGLVEITATSEDDRLKITAEGKAEVKGVASGEISLNYAVSKLTRNRQSRVTVNAVGGGLGLSPMDAPSFVKLAREFPAMVNGGEAETVEFQTVRVERDQEDDKDDNDTEEQIEDEQIIVKSNIKFPGIAVPVRAIVRTYKSLPVFSVTSTVLTRLSSYVTDDLIDYYLTYDEAKNRIADLMQNDNDIFQVNELEKLGDIRDEVRDTQVTALEAIDKAATAKDIDAASDAANSLAELTPGEVFLRRAFNLQDDANVRIEEEGREMLVAERLQKLKENAVLQKFRELGDATLQVGSRGIQSGDELALQVRSRGVYVSPEGETNVFSWKSEGLRTMGDLAKLVKTGDARTDILDAEIRAREARLSEEVYNSVQRQIAAEYADSFASGSVPPEYLNRAWRLRNFQNDRPAWRVYIQRELRAGGGESGAIAETGALEAVQNAISVGPRSQTPIPGETFTFQVENASEGIVSLRADASGARFWQHVLQVRDFGVVVARPRTDEEDESFLFKLVSVGFASEGVVRIETDGGRYRRSLFLDEETRVLLSRPTALVAASTASQFRIVDP